MRINKGPLNSILWRAYPSPGFILIMVLIIIMLASMVAASLLFVLSSEHTASAAGSDGDQALAAAMSGINQALRVAAEATPGSFDWQDNPAMFQQQLVTDDGARKWYFSVYSVGGSNTTGICYGLADEAGKINVNRATATMLEALPNITPPLAEALLSFISTTPQISAPNPEPDAAEQPLQTNAPQKVAAGPRRAGTNSVATPLPAITVAATNRQLSCLEELLQVSGFTPQLLYGEDANLNGRLDANEDDGDTSFPGDNQDGQLDLGLRAFLTVSSYDLNVDNEGNPRININQPDADLTGLQLPQETLAYLAAMRRSKQTLAHPADLLEATNKFLDEKGKEVGLPSAIAKTDLGVLLDRCTTVNENRLAGLINLNTASAQVLAALPGSNEALAESIVSARANLSPEARKSPAWLYQEGLVNADIFKKMAPYLTTRTYQFHFQVAAYAVPAGTFRVFEAVIDTAARPPAIVFLRDITRLGMPFNITTPAEPENQTTATLRPLKRMRSALMSKPAVGRQQLASRLGMLDHSRGTGVRP